MLPAVDAAGKPIMYDKWRTVVTDYRGRRKTITLSASRQQSQKHADMLEAREREIRSGLRPVPTPADQARRRPYVDVAEEYLAWGNAQGGRGGRPWSPKNAAKRKYYLDWWREALRAETLADLDGSLPRAEKALQKLAAKGRSGKTLCLYREGLFTFCLWCKDRRYLLDNPFASMSKFDSTPRNIRRAMSLAEISTLLESGPRHKQMLYETAFATGFRAGELRSLDIHSLDVERSGLCLSAEADKGRKERFQPLSADLVKRLAEYAKTGEAGELYARMFAKAGQRDSEGIPPEPLLYVPSQPARTIQDDLERVGIPVRTAEGKLDFHACRTAYVNLVIASGADIKTAQTLSRHSTPQLTLNTYGRANDSRLSAVAEIVGQMIVTTGKTSDTQGDRGGNNRNSVNVRRSPPLFCLARPR
jgi:integrase